MAKMRIRREVNTRINLPLFELQKSRCFCKTAI